MNNRRYRHRLLALSASILLGLSGLSSSAVDAAEVTVERPAADTTVSQDTGNPSADTKEAAEGQTEGETTEPERIEPDAYFEPIQSNDTANWPQGPAVWAESAVVMDLDSGTFLYSKNMDVAKYPASITKILTTLIAIEHSRPSEKVTFSENAVYGIEQGSSNIGIRLGENLTMEDCLYGMMLESANEVCVAVAEHISGSVDAFVELMNQKAASLGCTNTHFTNAAYNLLQQLLYYAKEMERTYIRIESTLLLAVTCYKMDRKEWKNLLQEAVSEAESYHFVRILTKEAGLWLPLLKKSREEIHWTDPHFHRQVLEEGKRMAQMYPGYLRTKAEGEVTLSDTARKILRMQAEGDSMNKIAGQLGLAEVTVKYHCRETYRKLGVNGKAAAVNEARKRKLI